MPTESHPEFIRECCDLQAAYEVAGAEHDRLEAERGRRMWEGREVLQPPLTFRVLAECFGVGVAAVQIRHAKLKKEKAKR